MSTDAKEFLTITKEILKEKLHFSCNKYSPMQVDCDNLCDEGIAEILSKAFNEI